MKHSRIVLAGTAVAVAAGLALVPSAAVGHTDNLYTWAFGISEDVTGGFATTSKADASITPLAENTIDIAQEVHGVEICNEVGYAIDTAEAEDPTILTWDHNTGAILTGPIAITLDSDEKVVYVVELDTLADCSVITIAYVVGEETEYPAILKVDPATGAAEVLLDLPEIDSEDDSYTGLATFAGTTYLFLDIDGLPYVSTVTFGDSISEPAQLEGLSNFFESSGFTAGVDFDPTGVLWLTTGVDEEQLYHLVSFAPGVDVASATPTDVGVLPYFSGGTEEAPYFINAPIPLAADGAVAAAPAPQLAATGSEAPFGIAAGALALLVAGGAVLVLRRRAA